MKLQINEFRALLVGMLERDERELPEEVQVDEKFSQTTPKSLGLDSLDMVELVMLIEKKILVPLPADFGSQYYDAKISKIVEDVNSFTD